MRALLVASLLFAVVAADPVSYSGHSVIRIEPQSETHNNILHLYIETFGVDVWAEPGPTFNPVDVRLSPEVYEKFTLAIKGAGLDYEVMIEDVEAKAVAQKARSANGEFFEAYHTLEEYYEYLDDLEERAVAKGITVERFVLTTSYEGRDILGIRFCGVGGVCDSEGRVGIFFNGGIHAREWVSPTTVLYIANSLVENEDALEGIDWTIVPVINVDGYVFTWDGDRMWRKTMQPNEKKPKCPGRDPNRNWDSHWGEAGASNNPCSEIYGGPEPFSEPCAKGIADWILEHPATNGYIDFHAYSQLIMTPWGWTKDYPEDYDAQYEAAQGMADAIKDVHGKKYKAGSIARIIYKASGSSADWAYEKAGVKYSIAVELRDKGRHGFLLPPDQIIPTGEEWWAATKVFAAAVKSG